MARDGSSSAVSRVDPFRQSLSSLISSDGSGRSTAYTKIKENWSTYRHRVHALTASGPLPEQLALAYLLSRLASKEDLPALRKTLESPNKNARIMAMHGLGRLRDRECMPSLQALLAKAQFKESQQIFSTLLTIHPQMAEKIIMTEHSAPEWARRRAVALALERLESRASGEG